MAGSLCVAGTAMRRQEGGGNQGFCARVARKVGR